MEKLFFEGLLLQASLIFALGAQNIFILESGLKKQFHLTASLVCFLCDFALIMLGVAGAATLFTALPQLKIAIGIIGVVFLLQYGLSKLFAKEETAQSNDVLGKQKSLKRTIMLGITFSILNPHAYLDAFVLIGGFSAQYPELKDRVMVGLGAAAFSGIWFVVLSTTSSTMKPFLSDPKRMKYVMATAGCLLVVLAGKLSIDVYGWLSIQSDSNVSMSTYLPFYPTAPYIAYSAIGFI